MSELRGIVRACQLAVVMLSTSVSTHGLAATKFDPLDPLGTLRKGSIAPKPAMAIEVAPGDWGGAEVGDIQRVLNAVAVELLGHVRPARDDLSVRVIPRSGSPRVLYEKGAAGQYVIQLTARDERWFQFAYQFAHELCHVLSNFDHKEDIGDGKVAEGNQWFEEALCETASLFVLRRLSAAWEVHPPTRNWAGYGSVLTAYTSRLTSESHRHLAAGQSFRDWYAANKHALQAHPYLREKNELVAAHLLPLFEARPESWQAITYLNPTKASAARSFTRYVADWQAASPDKTLPEQVRELFGLSLGIEAAELDGRVLAEGPGSAPAALPSSD